MTQDSTFWLVAVGNAIFFALIGVLVGLATKSRMRFHPLSLKSLAAVLVCSAAPIALSMAIATTLKYVDDRDSIHDLRNDLRYRNGYQEELTSLGPIVKAYWIWQADTGAIPASADNVLGPNDALREFDRQLIFNELRADRAIPPVIGGHVDGFSYSSWGFVAIYLLFAVPALIIHTAFLQLTWWLFRAKPVQEP